MRDDTVARWYSPSAKWKQWLMGLCVLIMMNYVFIIIMLLYYEKMKETLYIEIQRSGQACSEVN